MKNKKIRNKKRETGITLIVIQIIIIISSISTNNIPTNIFSIIGFLSFGIVGILMLISSKENITK